MATTSHKSRNAGWIPFFELEGLGKEYWKNVDPDEFVRQLREGWDEPHRSQES